MQPRTRKLRIHFKRNGRANIVSICLSVWNLSMTRLCTAMNMAGKIVISSKLEKWEDVDTRLSGRVIWQKDWVLYSTGRVNKPFFFLHSVITSSTEWRSLQQNMWPSEHTLMLTDIVYCVGGIVHCAIILYNSCYGFCQDEAYKVVHISRWMWCKMGNVDNFWALYSFTVCWIVQGQTERVKALVTLSSL